MARISLDASGLTISPRLEFFEDGDHVPRSGNSQAVLLILGQLACGAPAFGRFELRAVAADLAHGARGLDADFVEIGIDRIGGEALENHVGGGIVAEHDHQVDHIAQRKLYTIGEFAADDAAAGYLVLAVMVSGSVHLALPAATWSKTVSRIGSLMVLAVRTGSVCRMPTLLAGVEVFGVERDGSLEVGDAGAECVLQGLGG